MNRINFYSLLLVVHWVLLTTTLVGCIYVVVIGQTDWLIAFLTVPLVNLLLIPLTRKDQKFDPTHPIFLILVSLLIGTVLRSFFIISPLQSDVKYLMLMGQPPTVLLKGIFCIYIGLISFVLGYIYPVKPLANWSGRKIFNAEISLKRFIPLALLLIIISIVSATFYFKKMGLNLFDVNSISQKRHYKVAEGNYSSLGNYRFFMDLIEPLFYLLIVYIILKKKRVFSSLGLLAFIFGILNMAYPFLESSRSNALYVLINSGLIIYYLKGGIKWRQIIIVLVIGSGALFIMTGLRERQSVANSKTSVTLNPLALMVGTLNFLGVDKTSQIIDKMPEKLDYQFGSTFFLSVLAPVPRAIWPNKPEITEGRTVGEKIYEKRDENTPGGSVPPGLIAEMYMNFSYLGVIFGLFIAGIFIKLFYNAFKNVRDTSMYGMLIYILIYIPFALKIMGSDFSVCFVKIFYYLIPAYLIMRLIQKNPEKKF